MKIYLASSWRNVRQPGVLAALKAEGYDVYDFRHPASGNEGFHWEGIDPDWQNWTPYQYVNHLMEHPVAASGFRLDWEAMQRADICVLLLPCGRSAHLEAGYFVGAGKELLILIDKMEPELMYKMANGIYTELNDLIDELRLWAE